MALVDLGPPYARDWVALLGGHRIELVRKPLQQREAVRDEGRGVVDQALALEHNLDLASVLAIATWRNCFGHVGSAERY
jgi:hypothetical protein